MTYFSLQELQNLDIKYPVEYVSLLSAVNTKLALECGFTAARSGGCLFNVDGDVLKDITLLEDRSRFIAVMQGGIIKAGQLTRTAHT